jgi:DNA polymerase III epsilon subunit-like protein
VLVTIDTETAGLKPEHPTIQVAATAREGGVELAYFEQKIAFDEAAADPQALAVNHYRREDWVDAVAGPIAASRFAAWLRPYCTLERVSKAGNPYRVARLAAYNAGFDTPRLEALFGTQFMPWDRRVRDVLQRVLFWFDEHRNEPAPLAFKLSMVAEHFGIKTDGAHDALADARMAAAVLEHVQYLQAQEERSGHGF